MLFSPVQLIVMSGLTLPSFIDEELLTISVDRIFEENYSEDWLRFSPSKTPIEFCCHNQTFTNGPAHNGSLIFKVYSTPKPESSVIWVPLVFAACKTPYLAYYL
jgi:hypothetical protein